MEFAGAEKFGFCGLLNWSFGFGKVFTVCGKPGDIPLGWLVVADASTGFIGENILLEPF
jgi:hypothetical protein